VTRIVLLAGASGSGKSRLAHGADAIVARLDDFYVDADAPDLPRTPHGFVDWDDVRTWDAPGAAAALESLSRQGFAEVPDYSIAESRRTGWHRLDLGGHPLVIAEGIFAIELLPVVRALGLPIEALYLDRSPALVAWLRLRRDLREHRKSPAVLLQRGLDLWRAQPALKRRALAAGFRPVTMRQGLALLSRTASVRG
jgi:uridine kinase